jgi:RHS repeat-associated protein
MGGRTSGQGYSQLNGNRKKWAQLESDEETKLDYAQNRYYSSTQGRFTSTDEFKGGPHELSVLGSRDPEKQALVYAVITNPQSLNKYQYTYNNPLRYIDPDGRNPQEGIGNVQDAEIRLLLEGKITAEQFKENMNARGLGGVAGVAIVTLWLYGPAAATAVLMAAARNPGRVEQLTITALEVAGGPPGAVTGAVGGASKAELSIARKLAAEGKNVEVVAATGVGRTADFIVNGVKTELKTLEGVGGVATSGTVKSAIGRALGQSGNVIIDASAVKLTLAEAEKGAARAFGADTRLQTVRIIGQDFDIVRVRTN